MTTTPNLTAVAAALVVAVADQDQPAVARALRGLRPRELRDLAARLAGHVNVDKPFAEPHRSHAWVAAQCIAYAADRYGTTTIRIRSTSRRREDVDARHAAAYAARICGLPLQTIGTALRMHHTTVMYAVSRVGELPRLRTAAKTIADTVGCLNPDEHPAPDLGDDVDGTRLDEAVVLRILAGERLLATRAERLEVIRRWEASGRSIRQLEETTGWNVHRMLRQVRGNEQAVA